MGASGHDVARFLSCRLQSASNLELDADVEHLNLHRLHTTRKVLG